MYSVWNSVLPWAFLSLFSSTAETNTPKNIKLQEEKTARLVGSCVTIQCEHEAQGEMQLLWFKNAMWDNVNKNFIGIIVYSNTKEWPQDPDYSGRVEFTNQRGISKTNGRSDCSLKINDLKMNDNGNYSFRYITQNKKYMSRMFNLTVTENFCKVHIKPLNKSLKEGDILSLHCATSKECASHPKWQSFGSSEIFSTNDAKDNEGKWSELKLTLNWKDDGRNLTCYSPESHADHCLDKSVTLTVEYAPQNTYIEGVHEIKLGLKLNLECFTEAKPPANNYSWYFKPEHEKYFLMLSHIGQKYLIDEVAVINAGVYKCSAQNVIGKGGNSSEINILVLYPPRKLKLTLQVVKENESYSITCTVESSPPSKLTLSRVSLTNPEKDEKMMMVISNFLNFTGKASVQDAGIYTCVAKNSEGQNSSNDQLKVLYAPKNVTVSAYPGNELKEGSELKLSCKANSVPEVSAYTWKKSFGTHSVIVGHGQTITLRLKISDSDHYFCISGNEIGSAESPAVYIRVKYRPHITIIHNMTSLGLLENAVPIHLICSVQSDPPVSLFAWYKLEENTTVLSTNQNYTVQPQYPGTYYCDASNEVGKSRSEPVKIYLYHFIIKWLVTFIISLLVILFLIGVIFLLQRIFLRKRCLGTNEADQRSFFFSRPPLSSNWLSSESYNNTRENLVTEGSSEISCFRDNHSGTDDYSYPLANRPTQAGRPDYNIQTTYDCLMLPSKLKHHNQEDLTMTTQNYVQFIDSNNPDKSVPNHDSCGPAYAKIFKKERMAKEEPGANEDYENVSGVCTTTQPFSNRNWDSDSSESEEGVNYTKVLFTATSQHNRQRDVYSSDEEDKTEYSQVKI